MDRLVAIPFAEDLLKEVVEFDCGDEDYQLELRDWLRVEAISFMAKGTSIWLFANSADDLVAYGSLGTTRWRFPDTAGKRNSLALIPAVAVQRQFWGKPVGPPEERYSSQILKFLIAQAQELPGIEPAIGLFVQVRNEAAIRFYERFGFKRFPHQYIDPTTKSVYQAMVRTLPGKDE